MALRYSDVPVVVAPAGLALGGGCEIALHADRVQAAGETYMGLVEVGVGLIPAGGGTKEMVARAMARLPSPGADPLPFVQQAFETVALAKVSASGPDAVRLGYLSDRDALHDEPRAPDRRRQGRGPAARADGGYRAAAAAHGDSRRRRVAGRGAQARRPPGLARRARHRPRRAHRPHAGARCSPAATVPHATTISEQHLLDLEREAFLRLLGEAEDAGAHPAHAEDRQAAEELACQRIIQRGTGQPIVLVPGIQGR